VYTQLTDVEVELNGFLTYDRAVLKFDTARTAAVNRGHAPYILPELGEFTDVVRVSISQGTPTEIRYTIDGSEPSAASALYRAPFTIARSTTVRAKSFINGVATAAPEGRVDYRKGPGLAPTMVSAGDGVSPGLDYEYMVETTAEPAFRMSWPVRFGVEHPVRQPSDLAAKKTGTIQNFSLAPRDTNELFSFRYTGYLRVPRTGVYTFTAISDDGAGLWFADRNVFWSLGQSPKATETSGQIALQAGLHAFNATYFQAYGPMTFEMYVEGPGLSRRRIPGTWLFRTTTRTTGSGE
jgi:hypothetical protein